MQEKEKTEAQTENVRKKKERSELNGIPSREALKKKLAELEVEHQQLKAQYDKTVNEVVRISQNIAQTKDFVVTDMGYFYEELRKEGLTPGKVLDKVYQKKKDMSTDRSQENLQKLEGLQQYLKRQLDLNRGKADKVRKTINELDAIQRVRSAGNCCKQWVHMMNRAFDTYSELQQKIFACQDEDLTKHMQKLGFSHALQVFFTSHLKPAAAPNTPMYQAVEAAMSLTAFKGGPLIKRRTGEITKQQDHIGAPRASDSYPIEKELY
jgi:hypothetical protein